MATRCWTVLATLVVTAALLVPIAQQGASTGSSDLGAVSLAARSSCADVAFVGAGGNGQRGSSLAAPLQQVYAATRSAVRDRSVEAVAVPWTTRTASSLRGKGTLRTRADRAVTPASASRWAGDVSGYTARLRSQLLQRASACPGQSLVLAGYAQGSLALHRLLAVLPTSAPSVHQRVVGVVLVSDGYRAKGAAQAIGAPAARRTGAGALAGRGAPGSVPTSAHRYPVLSVCSAGDAVCDRGPQRLRRALAVHQGYAAARGVVSSVGSTLARAVVRAPLPGTPTTLTAMRGVPAQRTLPVRVLAADRDDVVVTVTGTLPPGMALSGSGTLSGTPTAVGSWPLTWTARNAAAPWTLPASGATTVVVTEPPAPEAAEALSAGGQHACRIADGGVLQCWGANDQGQLGTGSRGGVSTAPVTVAPGQVWRQVSAGGSTTCAVRIDGTLWCWGLNHEGQVGDGTRTTRLAPVRVGGSSSWASVSTDWFTTCATTVDGRALCWGQNSAGQVGDGTTTTRLRPVYVAGAAGWRSVQTAGWHSCGVRTDGTAACWGRNDFGELGNGGFTRALAPRAVPGGDWRALSLSWGGSCGVRDSGTVQCWGRNDQGQVGDGTRTRRANPQRVDVPPARTVAAGDSHACALTTDWRAFCWGSGDYGNTGLGQVTRSLQPVDTGRRVVALDAGWMHTCGQDEGGAVACWGNNTSGQLGDGTQTDSAGRGAPAAGTGPLSFTLATYNVLGNNHTAPGADDDHFAPAWIRAQWTVQTWRDRDLSIVSTQESDGGQIEALQRAAGGEYAAWPGLERGRTQGATSLWWRTSEWQAISRTTLTIPFMTFKRLVPVVQLQSRADPSRTVWVMGVHNSPGAKGQGQRNRALAIEVPELQRMVGTGAPVLVAGDFNEQTAFCRVAPKTGLSSPRGGSVSNGTCTPPGGRVRIDWLFGPAGVWSQYAENRDAVVARTTDHHLISSRVTLR